MKCKNCKFLKELEGVIPSLQGNPIYWCVSKDKRIGAYDPINKKVILDIKRTDRCKSFVEITKNKASIIWKKQEINKNSFILENDEYLVKYYSCIVVPEADQNKLVIKFKKMNKIIMRYTDVIYPRKITKELMFLIESLINNFYESTMENN